jgi:hypothetical protein
MWWLVLLLFFIAPALAEPVTTANVLPALSAFITSGSTTSTGGTGNATAGGGTYTSSFDVGLTAAEVRQGFTLNSAVTVNSHSSNAVLATCTTLTQVGDCRDIFRLGLKLFDGTALAADFLHEVELDFGGLRDYTFTDTFAANDFGVLTGELSLWGIDAGWHSGFFGPQFLNPSLTFAYQTVPVEQQIMDQIIDQIVMETIAPPPLPPPPVEMAPTSQTAGPPPPATMTATMEPQAPEPPAPPTIEPIAPPPPPEQQQEEAAAVAEIEAEIQAAEPEPQPAEPETREAAAPQASPEPRQTRQQKVKAAAQRIVKKIAPSQRYSAASQTTMMVVMNLLSGKIATGPAIKDATAATFFSAANVPDGPSMVDRMMHYRIFGHANGLHNALVDSQYRK